MHIPYQERFARQPDFEVTYQLYTHEEGGRSTPVYQGILWNFRYEERHKGDPLWMIYPEFLDLEGNIVSNEFPIPMVGRAFMWVLNPTSRNIHRKRIYTGTRGYFMEGAKRVGVCEVITILALSHDS